MRTIVYVDGFNLYYGLLKGTSFKWLDMAALFAKLLPKNDLVLLKYFTAGVVSFAGNPDAPRRQRTYLRALRAGGSVEIHLGHFLASEVTMRLADGSGRSVRVIKHEEKGSDVNLAVHLVADGFKGSYDAAVVVSNDSDLAEAMRIIRENLSLPVGLVPPVRKADVRAKRRRVSKALVAQASFTRSVSTGLLKTSQLPQTISDSRGSFSRPSSW
jgi:hypothetical protein